ncbi:MAG: hypothetical protein ACRC92_01465, partial [Peptostreptococcaceae bacterium]
MASNNCDGIISVDFTTFVVVNGTMNVIDIDNNDPDALDNIKTYITVNASNLYAYVKEEPYCPEGGIEVPDPCNSGISINVPCVTLNEVRVSGPINFVIGLPVLETTGRATDSVDPGVYVEFEDPTQSGDIISAYGGVFINDEVLEYLDSLDEPAPSLLVTVKDLKV